MFFRIVIVCLVLAASYAVYQIVSVNGYYRGLRNPLAEFTVAEREGNQNPLTIVEFMHYDCGYCKDTHIVLVEFARKTPEIRLVTRPVPYEGGGAEAAAKRAMAAGLQGKFWEMDSALSEYKGPMDDKFYRESAALYDIDYDRMVADAEDEKVLELLKDNAHASQRAGVKSTPAFMIGKTLYELDVPLTLPDLIRMVRAEQAQ
jgi:protein-disulfide isomerase